MAAFAASFVVSADLTESAVVEPTAVVPAAAAAVLSSADLSSAVLFSACVALVLVVIVLVVILSSTGRRRSTPPSPPLGEPGVNVAGTGARAFVYGTPGV